LIHVQRAPTRPGTWKDFGTDLQSNCTPGWRKGPVDFNELGVRIYLLVLMEDRALQNRGCHSNLPYSFTLELGNWTSGYLKNLAAVCFMRWSPKTPSPGILRLGVSSLPCCRPYIPELGSCREPGPVEKEDWE
jgi:hypothetical protein